MKRHVKLYMQAHGYKVQEEILCELCGRQAQDIDHIRSRGMGGDPSRDRVSNLQALCRECHARKHNGGGAR